LLSGPFLALILGQGAMLAAIALAAYALALQRYGPGDHARTVVLLALVGVQVGQTFNCRSRTHSAFEGLFHNPHIWFATATVIAIQIGALSIAPLRRLLHLVPPTPEDGVIAVLCIVLPIAIVEVQKVLARRIKASPSS
jgi:magnesium-transporting ATPase (P-type)